jgi:hypothetical protein
MPRRKIATVDCETDPFEIGVFPKPFIWGFYDGEEYLEFENATEMLQTISNRKIIVYAHNGGKFDYHFMLEHLEAFSDIMIINGRLARFKIGNCEFRDSYNLLPLPLAAMKKDDFDYSKLHVSVRDKHMDEIRQYLENDCVYLHEFVSTFIETFGLNLTLASSAMKEWKKLTDFTPKTDVSYYHQYKKYYYGGRVECFENGIINDDLVSFDINSAYPFAMLEKHGYGEEVISKEFGGKFINQNFYTIDATSNGALPLRAKGEGLGFPQNHRDIYHVTGWEINTGLETGTLEVHSVAIEHEIPVKKNFKEYIYKFYEQKKTAKPKSPDYIFAKLMMNSLYGKFAANSEKYTENMICNTRFIEAAEEDGYEFAGELGEWAVMRQPLPEEKHNYYNVLTAASITGFVRAYLWRHVCNLRQNGEQVLYCDTDCIFSTRKNPIDKVYSIGNELGEWDKEGEYISGAIAGKKLYAFKDEKGNYKKASKGCRLNGDEIFSLANGKIIVYKDFAPVYSMYKAPYFQERKIKPTF